MSSAATCFIVKATVNGEVVPAFLAIPTLQYEQSARYESETMEESTHFSDMIKETVASDSFLRNTRLEVKNYCRNSQEYKNYESYRSTTVATDKR